MDAALDRKAEIADTILAQQVDGETVILDLAGETYFGLDEVGTRIWDLIGEGRRLAEIHAVLCAEYDAPSDVLRDDLLVLLDELAVKGLVSFVPGEAGDAPGEPTS